MRKLILQMQLSADGYAADSSGQLDWLVWDWDAALKEHVNKYTENVDCILLGRNLAEGFIPSWKSKMENPETADEFGQKMIDTPKIVFSATATGEEWDNTMIIRSDAETFIRQLKSQPGKDIMVYGGCGFANSLVDTGLIDEYRLYINPVALGKGIPLFKTSEKPVELKLIHSIAFGSGIVLLQYAHQPGGAEN